jgi:hypothetical protein
MTLSSLQKGTENVIQTMDELVLRSAMQNESIIVDLNTKNLSEGKDVNGNPIQPSYASPKYAQYKQSLGSLAPMGTPDLKLTGDYYSGKYLQKMNEGWLEMHSTDWKEKQLNAKYGEIEGLPKDSIKEANEYILPDLIKNIKNELFSS